MPRPHRALASHLRPSLVAKALLLVALVVQLNVLWRWYGRDVTTYLGRHEKPVVHIPMANHPGPGSATPRPKAHALAPADAGVRHVVAPPSAVFPSMAQALEQSRLQAEPRGGSFETQSHSYAMPRRLAVLVADSASSVLSLGQGRPRQLVPLAATQVEAQVAVLCHEAAVIGLKDVVVVAASAALTSLPPFDAKTDADAITTHLRAELDGERQFEAFLRTVATAAGRHQTSTAPQTGNRTQTRCGVTVAHPSPAQLKPYAAKAAALYAEHAAAHGRPEEQRRVEARIVALAVSAAWGHAATAVKNRDRRYAARIVAKAGSPEGRALSTRASRVLLLSPHVVPTQSIVLAGHGSVTHGDAADAWWTPAAATAHKGLSAGIGAKSKAVKGRNVTVSTAAAVAARFHRIASRPFNPFLTKAHIGDGAVLITSFLRTLLRSTPLSSDAAQCMTAADPDRSATDLRVPRPDARRTAAAAVSVFLKAAANGTEPTAAEALRQAKLRATLTAAPSTMAVEGGFTVEDGVRAGTDDETFIVRRHAQLPVLAALFGITAPDVDLLSLRCLLLSPAAFAAHSADIAAAAAHPMTHGAVWAPPPPGTPFRYSTAGDPKLYDSGTVIEDAEVDGGMEEEGEQSPTTRRSVAQHEALLAAPSKQFRTSTAAAVAVAVTPGYAVRHACLLSPACLLSGDGAAVPKSKSSVMALAVAAVALDEAQRKAKNAAHALHDSVEWDPWVSRPAHHLAPLLRRLRWTGSVVDLDSGAAVVGQAPHPTTAFALGKARDAALTGRPLVPELNPVARAVAPKPHVVWATYCACSGFNTELVYLAYALRNQLRVRLPAGLCGCPGAAAPVEDAKLRRAVRLNKWGARQRAFPAIVIQHRLPTRDFHAHNSRYTTAYRIARVMTETTKMRGHWARTLAAANEVWVPSKWGKAVLDRGIPADKVQVIPETIDIDRFNPDAAGDFPLPLDGARRAAWRHYTNRDEANAGVAAELKGNYKFLSQFKWELRKGYDVLLNAFRRAFTAADRVSLYILTSKRFAYTEPPLDGIRRWAKEHGVDLERDLAHIVVLDHAGIPGDEMTALYHAADAFVLPTRGEGWGLSPMQAMALAKPTITTMWGGQLEYMAPHACFGIEMDGLVQIQPGEYVAHDDGMMWAQPSVNHTAYLMRHVVDHPDHAAAVGRRGRQHIVAHFSPRAVAAVIAQRVQAISAGLEKQGVVWPDWGEE